MQDVFRLSGSLSVKADESKWRSGCFQHSSLSLIEFTVIRGFKPSFQTSWKCLVVVSWCTGYLSSLCYLFSPMMDFFPLVVYVLATLQSMTDNRWRPSVFLDLKEIPFCRFVFLFGIMCTLRTNQLLGGGHQASASSDTWPPLAF